MNILFKINKRYLIIVFSILTILLISFIYSQFSNKKYDEEITYGIEADIINPKFVKEKSNKDYLKVIANKASFLSESKMFLEGNVKYKSNNFTF